MGVIDRGVDFLETDYLHKQLEEILAPFELALVCFVIPVLLWVFAKYVVTVFPNTLFRWILMLDWAYGLFMGPLRWFPGNPLYSSMATPTNPTGCRFAVFIDTFCQIGLLYTNTVIVATVFVTIYFQQKVKYEKYNNWCKNGFWCITIVVAMATSVSGDVHNYVGWCTADSASVIFKQLTWFLALVLQVTMIIPTNYIVWKATKGSRRRIGSGVYLRFVSTIFTQFIGIFPLMSVEFLGLARKTIPSWIMWSVIIFFPVAHLLDAAIMSIKLWPILLGSFAKSDNCKWLEKLANDNSKSASHASAASKGMSQGRGSTQKSSGSTNSHSVGSSALSLSSTGSTDSSDMSSQGSRGGRGNSASSQSDSDFEADSDMEDSRSGTEDNFTTQSGTSNGLSSLAEQMSTGNSSAYKEYEKMRSGGGLFDKLPFWVHLSLTIFIPFILLTTVTMLMVTTKITFKDEAQEIEKDIHLSEKISNLVHESQKERGNTGVFMGSLGQKFQCELLAQYTLTSTMKTELQIYLDEEFENVRLVTKSTFLSALINMLGLEAHRELVQAQSITKGQGLTFYTNMNMFFVGVVAEICHDSTLGFTIQHKMFSNLAFFLAKEYAGIERAVGTGMFAAGGQKVDTAEASEQAVELMDAEWERSNANAFKKFTNVVTAQSTHDFFFQVYVNDADARLYVETMDNIVVHVSIMMMDTLLENNVTLIAEHESGDWFDMMTAKINLIRSVEASLASDLTFDAQEVVNSSTRGMILVVCSLAIVLIIDGLMILGLARTSEALRKFSVGRHQVKNKRTKGCIDWIASMSNNMNFTYQILLSVGLCGLGLIVVSWMLLQEQVTASQAAATTWENMHLQYYLSNYIHETQKERGATGVFVGNFGAIFRDVLEKQKTLTAVFKAELVTFLLEFIDFDALKEYKSWKEWDCYMDPIYCTGTETSGFWRTGLMYMRSEVAKLTVIGGTTAKPHYNSHVTGALGYYTQHNARITQIAREIVSRASGNSIEARLLGYLGFIYMKEKAGNERAVGTVGFAGNGWATSADFRKFVMLVAIQDAAFEYFATFGSIDQNKQFEETKTNKGSITAMVMRADGLSNDDDKMANIDPADWYGNITEKINQWRFVEERIATDLLGFFASVTVKADNFLLGAIIMLCSFFVVAVYVIQKGIRLLLSSRAYMLYRERLKLARSKKKKEEKKKKKQAKLESHESKSAAV